MARYGTHEKCIAIGRDRGGRDLVCSRSRGHSGNICYDASADQEFTPEYRKYPAVVKENV